MAENRGAADITLSADDLAEIDASTVGFAVEGARLPEAVLKMTRL